MHRAQATVEFAMTLPLFLLMLLALIDFSRLLFTYVSLADGAREMARALALSHSQSTSTINAFNNYVVLASTADPSTDQVTIAIADASCATDQQRGQTCSSASLQSITCTLPLQLSCAVPSRVSAGGGYVQVDVTYTFKFNPLFQNDLARVTDVVFLRPLSVLTTSARTYLE